MGQSDETAVCIVVARQPMAGAVFTEARETRIGIGEFEQTRLRVAESQAKTVMIGWQRQRGHAAGTQTLQQRGRTTGFFG